MFFILYLALPQTQGAKFVYNRYVAPFFGEYGLEIEGLIKRGHDVGRQAGLGSHGGGRNAQTGSLGMLGNVGIMAGGMLGTIAPAWFGGNQNVHSASPAADRTAPVSYADTLLSRFRIPSADGLAYGKAYDIPDPASLIPGSGKSASKGPVPSGIAGDSSRSEAKGSPLGTGYTSYINDGFAQATSILGAARGISKKEHSGAVSTGSERERAAETSGYGDRRRVVSGGSYRSDRLDDSDLDSASEEDVRRRSGGAGKQTGDRRRRSDYRD